MSDRYRSFQRQLVFMFLLVFGFVSPTLAIANASVTLSDFVYEPNESLELSIEGGAGDKAWVGIYNKADSNDWSNVIRWDWVFDGDFSLPGVPAGEYEARLFFNNSFNLEARAAFNVGSISIHADKPVYSSGASVNLSLGVLSGDDQDWVGIYRKGDSNDWGNMIRWDWVNNRDELTLSLEDLPVGDYEARLFFHNSFDLEAKAGFSLRNPSISSEQTSYGLNESISISVDSISGDKDWVGVYRKGDSSDWSNMIRWGWVNDREELVLSLEGVESGDYEARLFFHNSFDVEAKLGFSIGSPSISTSEASYAQGQSVTVMVDDLLGEKDWVGIYRKSDSHDWDNVLQWDWVDGRGEFSLSLEDVSAGDYEARLFFRNSFELEAKAGFSVANAYPPETVFIGISTDNSVNNPGYLGSVIDPVFDTKITRITDRSVDTSNAQPYPKVQVWNSDISIIRLGYRLYDARTYRELAVTQASKIDGQVNHMRWSTIDPKVFYGIKNNGVDEVGQPSFNFVKATVESDRISYTALHSFSKSTYEMFTLGKYEGNIDFNNRYVVFAARKHVGEKILTAIVYDIEENKVIAKKDLNDIAWPVDTSESAQILDWISISPLGNYILINWKEDPQGGDTRYSIHKYDRKLNLLSKLANKGAHGDIGVDANGEEVYVQFEFGNDLGIWSYNLNSNQRTRLLPDKYNGGHISCRNDKRPGWCYVSTNSERYKEAFAVKLDGSGLVNRFAQTRKSGPNPHAGVSPDGSKVMFLSDWGDNALQCVGATSDVCDSYVAEVQ